MAIGANIGHINDSTFTMATSGSFKKSKKVILYVYARQDASDTTETGIIIDSILVPLK